MSELKERLVEARKAKNMTQQQLADAMNVTRATVSHWENGQRMPDVENIQRLQQVLEMQLVTLEAEAEPAAEEQENEPKKKCIPDMKKYWGHVLSFAAGVVVTLAVVLLVNWCGNRFSAQPSSAMISYAELNAQPYSWYKEVPKRLENQAYVEITAVQNPVPPVEEAAFSGGRGWFWSFKVQELNGISFIVDEYTMTAYIDETEHGTFDQWQGNVDFFHGSNVLEPGEAYRVNGGMPVQGVIGVAVTLSGRDAFGNLLQFRGYADLLQ